MDTRVLSDLIQIQARKIAEDCDRAALRDSLAAVVWRTVNLVLGLASVVAAATAALLTSDGASAWLESGGLNKNQAIGLGALISAILASILTFLAPAEKANIYHEYSNKLRSLRDRVRAFSEIDCYLQDDVLRQKFDAILIEKNKLDAEHPIVPEWAYLLGRRRIKRKEKEREEREKRKNSAVGLAQQHLRPAPSAAIASNPKPSP